MKAHKAKGIRKPHVTLTIKHGRQTYVFTGEGYSLDVKIPYSLQNILDHGGEIGKERMVTVTMAYAKQKRIIGRKLK